MDYQIDQDRVMIENLDFRVTSAKVVSWTFSGPPQPLVVSKGIQVQLNVNPLTDENILDLYRNRHVDSLLLAINKIDPSGRTENIRNLFYPLVHDKNPRWVKTNTIKGFIVRIYYSSMSREKRGMTDFQEEGCPPFNHDKVLDEGPDIKSTDENETALRSFPGEKPMGKVIIADVLSDILDAGPSLVGEYQFQLALFNSRDKLRLSNFILSSHSVHIPSENSVIIKGCSGAVLPYKSPQETKKTRPFHFRR